MGQGERRSELEAFLEELRNRPPAEETFRIQTNLDPARHVPTGATKHFYGLPPNQVPVPTPVGLAIVQYDDSPAFYLYYLGGDGKPLTDTWHQTLDDAKHQAEREFRITAGEWPGPERIGPHWHDPRFSEGLGILGILFERRFTIDGRKSSKGSGGAFDEVTFRRADRSVRVWMRNGAVSLTYLFGDRRAWHSELVEALGSGPGSYPTFGDSPIASFEAAAADLSGPISPFIEGPDQLLQEAFAKVTAPDRERGFQRLLSVERKLKKPQ